MKKQLQDSPGEQTGAPDAPRGEPTPDQAGEQLADDLMQFRKGLGERVAARLPGHLALRIPVFVGLAFVLVSWLQRHRGWDIDKMLLGSAGALATYSFALPLLQRVLSKHRETIERGVADASVQYLGFLLCTPVLAVLFLATLIPNLFFSSVTVMAGDRAVVLRPVDQAADDQENALSSDGSGSGTAVGIVSTSPFGRLFRLEVEGYQPLVFTLYPGLGKEFDPAVDLSRANAVVLRLPPEQHDLVNENGEVRLFRRDDQQNLQLIGRCATRKYHGAYVFGWFNKDIRDHAEGWDLELEANDSLSSLAEQQRTPESKWSVVKWTWQNAVRDEFEPGVGAVETGDQLEAFYLAVAADGVDSVRGHASFVVTENDASVDDQMLFYLPSAQRAALADSEELRAAMPPQQEPVR